MKSSSSVRLLTAVLLYVFLAVSFYFHCVRRHLRPNSHHRDANFFNALMTSRRNLVNVECIDNVHFNDTQPKFFWSRDFDLAWCPVAKAGSTSWANRFVEFATHNERHRLFLMKHSRFNVNMAREIVRSEPPLKAKKFLIVRHPFHRLVESFRDLFERETDEYLPLAKRVTEEYREAAIERFGKDFFSGKRNYGTLIPIREGRRWITSPSFWEFIQWVKVSGNPSEFDLRWRPISASCSVCDVDYDFILKYESLESEEPALLTSLGLEDLMSETSWARSKSRKPTHSTTRTDANIAYLYFHQQLDEEDVETLYRFYEDDFRLFGYEFRFHDIRYPRR